MIWDGSSGVFHPATDSTLDLSGAAVPQFSSIFIDAGSGSLGLLAGNQIVLTDNKYSSNTQLPVDRPLASVSDTDIQCQK